MRRFFADSIDYRKFPMVLTRTVLSKHIWYSGSYVIVLHCNSISLQHIGCLVRAHLNCSLQATGY